MIIKTGVNALSSIQQFALQYAGRGWPVFRLTGYKVPLKGSHGFKDATTDPDVIESWWSGTGVSHNIGLATGAKIETGAGTRWLVVIDCDGEEGLAEFLALAAAGGGVPRTLVAKTSGGWHFYFYASQPLRSHNAKRDVKGGPGIDLKGTGGYVVLPPSVNAKNDWVYIWANQYDSIADLPPWAESYWLPRTGKRKEVMPTEHSNRQPEMMPDSRRLVGRALALHRQSELTEFLQALRQIDACCGYDQWFEVGAAIHEFDPGIGGLAVFKAWSRTAEGYREDVAAGVCERKWVEYEKGHEGKPITRATVFHLAWKAREGGDAGVVPPSPASPWPSSGSGNTDHTDFGGQVNGHALPAGFMGGAAQSQIHFIDTDKNGDPRGTTTNAGQAIGGLGIICSKDTFHEKMLVGGHAIGQWAGNLSDDVVLVIRKMIKRSYGFDPGEKNTRDAALQLCLENQFNPVTDYLAECQNKWDGIKRVSRWVVDYLGAKDTILNREFGRLMLIAAVRRARYPGTKFDQVVVWEGKEGTGKSTAIKILAGEDNFSDQNILAASDKEQQEAFCGVWLHEIAELAGMRRTDVDRIKQFASRTEDRARPAYGRIRVDMKRRGIFIATTNENIYLKSDTGNRRFWPFDTGIIHTVELTKDRNQLWGEAAHLEASGSSIELGMKFRILADEQQEDRRDEDTWLELVLKATMEKSDVSIMEILQGGFFQMKPSEIKQLEQNRIARILRQVGFRRYQKRIDANRTWRYCKG